MKIGHREIGPNCKPLVIPEIGINHGGDYFKAMDMIYDIYNSGGETVKFQCHISEDEMCSVAKNIVPSNANEDVYTIIKKCELSEDDEYSLKQLTESLGMIYLSTPFSRAAVDRLEKFGVQCYKIGSGETNNLPLVEYIASKGKPIILSTGMNDLQSIQYAVDIFHKYKVEYALLQCTSMYPTPHKFVNLGGMVQLREMFENVNVGLSDHSIGNYTCFGAVALGGVLLEKHFTHTKRWNGPDISISIDPEGLKDLITGCNAVWEARGGKKEILKEEQGTIDFAYASVVTIKNIKKGEEFTYENIWVKRPGGGILAKHFKNILGKKCSQDLQNDQMLTWEDVVK